MTGGKSPFFFFALGRAHRTYEVSPKCTLKYFFFEALLQKEKARLNAEKRKERNGQLIAFGIFMEEYLKDKPRQIPSMKQSMQKLLEGRNLDRALAGVLRLEEWLKQNEKALEEILVKENWDNNFSGSSEREISLVSRSIKKQNFPLKNIARHFIPTVKNLYN